MKNDKYVALGARVKEERIRLGLTQEQAAEKCEVTRVQWGRYERGLSDFSGRVLKAFVSLGADMQYILTGIRAHPYEVDTLKSSFEFIETLPLEQREESRRLLEAGIIEQSSKLAMRAKKRQDLMLILDNLEDEDFDLVIKVAVNAYNSNLLEKQKR